jgi:hypothetical protein
LSEIRAGHPGLDVGFGLLRNRPVRSPTIRTSWSSFLIVEAS